MSTMPNQFSQISGNKEMGVSGSPNSTSSGQLMGADNQKIQNNSDLEKMQVNFFHVKGHGNGNVGLIVCFTELGIQYPAILLVR